MAFAKICGIRNEQDMQRMLPLKPDAIGVICGVTAFSEDAVSPEVAAQLFKLPGKGVVKQLVSHYTDPKQLLQLAAQTGADALQVQTPLSVEASQELWEQRGDLKIVRVVHVVDQSAVANAKAVAAYADAILLDSKTASRLGGSGQTHDWAVSAAVVQALALPVILAGGLSPANLAEAIEQVNPYGVDANSQLDDSNGNKEISKCRLFLEIAQKSSLST